MSKIIRQENTRIEKCKYCSLVCELREGAEPRCCSKAHVVWRTSNIVDMADSAHRANG